MSDDGPDNGSGDTGADSAWDSDSDSGPSRRREASADGADTDTSIRALDEATVRQIAAGEVVERPASVVKELVENSLDAGASRIAVAVEAGGTDGIRVRDDGVGMSRAELELAVQEHTTSKIVDIDDLESGVGTLGFRGEALYTVGAVSKLTIRSKPRGATGAGTELTVEGGEVVDVGPVGCPEGTVVEVADLFYNTPARRKFLKTDATEFDHVNTVVTQYALANPDVAVSLEHDGREVFATEGRGSLRSTVLSVYGREVAESMLDIGDDGGDASPGGDTETHADTDTPAAAGENGKQSRSGDDNGGGDSSGDGGVLVGIEGLVSDPETTRADRSYVSTFVNGRYVTSSVLRDAVVSAYGDQLAPDRYPFAVLFLEIAPESVDVNVHPRKMEVRFDRESAVRDGVREAVRSALLESGVVRSSAPRGRSAPDEVAVDPEQSDGTGAGATAPASGPTAADDSASTADANGGVTEDPDADGTVAATPADDRDGAIDDPGGQSVATGRDTAAGESDDEDGPKPDSGPNTGSEPEPEPEPGHEPGSDSVPVHDDLGDGEDADDGDRDRDRDRDTPEPGTAGGIAADTGRSRSSDRSEVGDPPSFEREPAAQEEDGTASPSTTTQNEAGASARSDGPVADRSDAGSSVDDDMAGEDATTGSVSTPHRDAGEDTTGDAATGADGRPGLESAGTAGSRRLRGPTNQQTLAGGDAAPEGAFDRLPALRVLGQYRETYLVAETDDGLVLIDQHAADERINYERLREEMAGDTPTQALAAPVEVELTAREAALFDSHADALAQLGFYAGRTGDRTVEVRTVPAVFDDALDPELLRDALTAFVRDGADAEATVDAVADSLLADLACYPSITGNTSLSEGSVTALLESLDDCDNPFACPHGRPTIVRVSDEEIDDRFERDYPGHAGRRAE